MVEISLEKNFARLREMTDSIGLIQHSKLTVPDLDHGYSIDDNARALLILARFSSELKYPQLAEVYLNYILNSKRTDGFFHNFKDKEDNWKEEDKGKIEDCYGRVMWALSEFIFSDYPISQEQKARKIFEESIDISNSLIHPMSLAYVISGFIKYLEKEDNEKIRSIAISFSEKLVDLFHKHSEDSWRWFLDDINSGASRMPLALILSGKTFNNPKYTKVGLEALDFLISFSFKDNIFTPVGNEWVYNRYNTKAKYDQQLIEAGAIIEACVEAYKITKEEKYLNLAKTAFDWFYGKNSQNKSLLADNGGVYDAVVPWGVNLNQGAESLIEYLIAVSKLKEINGNTKTLV
jgi:hypothetical protein